MNEREILDRFGEFDVGRYCQALRRNGRLALCGNDRDRAAELYELGQRIQRNQTSMSPDVSSIVNLADRFLGGEWFLHQNMFANYPSYISAPILSLALRLNRRQIMSRLMNRAEEVLRVLLLDLLAVETASLAGIYPYYPNNTCHDSLLSRIKAVRKLCDHVGVSGVTSPTRMTDALPADWQAYVGDRHHLLPLIYMATFPLTEEHDEFFFIRTLQMSECCFWGALAGVVSAIEFGRCGKIEPATAYLKRAAYFVSLLINVTHALKTMPPEHFQAFRDATDGSSAIQSRAHHLLLIHVQGVDERKTKIFADIPEIVDLLHYGNASFLSLRDLLVRLHDEPAGGLDEFTESAKELDQALYNYRCLHLGIVNRYLPADAKVGTGGTAGVSYLRTHLRRRVWPLNCNYPFPDCGSLASLGTAIPLLGHGN